MFYYIAPGASVSVKIQQFHANFTLVAETAYTSYTWDPTGALYLLMGELAYLGRSGPDLAAIRDAVIPTYSHA